MTPGEVERIDRWAGDLATRVCNGDMSHDEADAEIASRVHSDTARRGKA